ncbi:cytochrome b5 domain containing 1 [Thecamonas trahens ATCC 50062]|uniref:Cytochrome b5 domain containing 1 n=1 Tax=Thecamonas trahens ATCC 50062 TaxID=461836 RepID=A0A0L0D2T4_THETB|nr:cytochrome b5 domain containing 1 [Thecamonas trahens ATCC 50062]KNC46609.1 cytochrome b5 domain containing 1 [Thecamonas trahens ATCC 50062]|eukprot:XP_013760382.1 cytochrome b5 domain containing 1 [Thecamonas trahens ATCC 50062]
MLKAAGTDISHWFEAKTGQPRAELDEALNLPVPYAPQGRYLHLPPNGPAAKWDNDFGLPWWMDPSRCIGLLSAKTRYIRITNTLTGQEDVLEVCAEETLAEILERYVDFNAHASSYTWKRLGRVLDMDLTLEENGIDDEEEVYYDLSLPDSYYYPAIYLYFNDDLTEA